MLQRMLTPRGGAVSHAAGNSRAQLASRRRLWQACATTAGKRNMKALVFAESGQPLRLEQRDPPEPETGDLLVKVAYCGICGSDVHATDPGPFQIATGTVLGHEFSGEVVESRAAGFATGDRVIGIPVRPCNECRAAGGECRDNLGIRCPNARVVGMS